MVHEWDNIDTVDGDMGACGCVSVCGCLLVFCMLFLICFDMYNGKRICK